MNGLVIKKILCQISLNNIYFVKLAQIVYKHNTCLHEWESETNNICLYINLLVVDSRESC